MNDDVNASDLPSTPAFADADTASTQPLADSSFIHRLFPKFNMSMPRSSVLITIAVVAGILILGGGGTYVVASNAFQPKPEDQNISNIQSSDIPSFNEKVSLAIPTFTPTPTVFIPTPTAELVNPSPAAGSSATANWSPYNFAPVFLNFSYPPGWYVNVAATSGAPYLFVQNYSSTTTPASSSGNFSIYIGRLEQVGITTIAQLTTQLALNAANNTYLGTVNMGTTTVISSSPITINGYSALQRTITYSAFPQVQYYEVYILDGVSNAIRFAPQLDITGTMPYFNQLLGTVDFTN